MKVTLEVEATPPESDILDVTSPIYKEGRPLRLTSSLTLPARWLAHLARLRTQQISEPKRLVANNLGC